MLQRVLDNRAARVVSTAVLLLLALGAIAAAWAGPGKSGTPRALDAHAPPAHSNSMHNRGPKPARTAFGSGCEYGAAVAHWASGKTKDVAHCSGGGAEKLRASSGKQPNAKGKGAGAKLGSSKPAEDRNETPGDGKAEETELEQPDVDDAPSPDPTASVIP